MPALARRIAAVAAGAVTLLAAFAAPATAMVPARTAGVIGTRITLAGAQNFGDGPYDVAVTPSGTAYIGWIGATVNSGQLSSVHLCTLPVNATSCLGGVQTIANTGSDPSLSDLRVLATRTGALLVWFHNTTASQSGPEGGAIATATAPGGQNLSGGGDVAPAPSNGQLLDAELAPNGRLWTVAYSGVGSYRIEVTVPGTDYLRTLTAPYSIGEAQLAFTGSKALLAITRYGAISTPAAYSVRNASGAWSRFANVAHTWTTGGLTLVTTTHGTRLITGVNDASYRPVLSSWTGASFTPRTLTADSNNCGPSSHDGSTDPSGRLVDASWECNDVTIADYADARHAALLRLSVSGIPTYSPQIGESTRGIATVVWSREAKAGGSDLQVTRVLLPTASRTVSGHARGGTVTVTGPISCLSVARTRVGVTGHAARGWKLLSRSLTMHGTKLGSSLDGAALAPRTSYTLSGTASFGKGTARSSAHASLTFRTC